MDATDEQRAKYEIGLDGDDIHWDEIDEDNPIADIFHRFPQLNVSEVARTVGINKSLLSRYIYGIKKPSQQRTEQILGNSTAVRMFSLIREGNGIPDIVSTMLKEYDVEEAVLLLPDSFQSHPCFYVKKQIVW